MVVGKPSGFGLRVISGLLHCPLDSILMVGDSVESDVHAANDAGAISCLINDSKLVPAGEEVELCFESLPDLVEYLEPGQEVLA